MRLIDADALIISLAKYRSALVNNHVPHGELRRIDEIIWKVVEATTVDAVPVVRCKDCKHYNTAGCSVGFGWCESMDRGVSDEFFCSCGAKLGDKP